MSVRIIPCETPDELYCHYDGQSEAQPCYIELDLKNGTLSADYDATPIGNAVPATVYYGIDRRYGIPVLTADAANKTMQELLPLANRIHADWEEVWNGSNWVAQLGGDAKAAEEEIENHLQLDEYALVREPNQGFSDSELVSVWDIDGVVNGCEAAEYDITADTTDQRLDEIAIKIMEDIVSVSSSDVAVCHGLHAHLRELRDDLERERAAAD